MQDAITLSVSPIQAILALAFQVWLVVFPIMIMRKIDRLTSLLEDRLGGSDEEGADQGQGEDTDADNRNSEV
jgi:hypothetical protein